MQAKQQAASRAVQSCRFYEVLDEERKKQTKQQATS